VNKETYLRDMKIRFRLTQRETDALRGLLDGLKNVDIAKNLTIAEQTVKDHLSRVYKKIGVKNRFELMRSLVKSSGRKARANIAVPVPAERELTEASLTDELTGIYNRSRLLALVEQQMKIARVVARLQKNLEHFNSKRDGKDALSISYASPLCDSEIPCSIDELLLRTETDKNKK
jgi:DNA-binding CsgD family transcriptional regulator